MHADIQTHSDNPIKHYYNYIFPVPSVQEREVNQLKVVNFE